MEPLQRSIPLDLKNMIMSSESSNLCTSCCALDLHFSNLPLFRQLLEQLVNPRQSSCAKNFSVALNSKSEGNAALKISNHEQALSSYTKALRYAPCTSKEEDKVFLATVFVNRAATLHKLKLFEPALRDSSRAIDMNPSYSKAWFRRSRIKYDKYELEDALSDMKQALACETMASGRKQIENEIALIESKWKSGSSSSHVVGNLPTESKTTQRECPSEVDFLQMHWSDERGWDLRTKKELDVGTFVFWEDPYAARICRAADRQLQTSLSQKKLLVEFECSEVHTHLYSQTSIVLKPYRDTRCHFCFEVLPADPVACYECAIPIYCSNFCRFHAAVGYQRQSRGLDDIHEQEENRSKISANDWYGEHRHECGGCAWPAVLPTEAVLAARILFRSTRESKITDMEACKSLEEKGGHRVSKSEKLCLLTCTRTVDTLCSNYERLSSNDKLEIHVLGVTLAHCLQQSTIPYMNGGSKVAATVASKLVLLIAQTRVNAMAIYCMSSPDPDMNSANTDRNPTTNTAFCTVEQVKVAQGIYLLGSSLNHSCVPNVHASFKLRRLYVHSILSIPAGSPLELCYGPQVGHMSQMERKSILQERYYFTCKCSACSGVTASDLFLRSFRCVKQSCGGVVLSPDSNVLGFPFSGTSSFASCSSSTEDVKTAQEGMSACISEGSVETPRTFSGGGDKNLRIAHFSEKDCQKGRTYTSVQRHSVPEVTSTDVEVSRKLTCKDMVGCCLECGTPVDVESAHEIARTAFSHLERIESVVLTVEAPVSSPRHLLKGALDALEKLRLVLHAYNEQLAKGEDVVARLLCAWDRPLDGLKHCENANKILERLYNKHHIVLGNEYLKLASVALIVPDLECARRSLHNADYIFRIHYGSDYRERLPYITELQRLVHLE